MSSLIENLTQARDQLTRMIEQIQGPLPIETYTFPDVNMSETDVERVKEEIERFQNTPSRTMQRFPPQAIYQCDPVARPQFMLIGRSGMWTKVRKEYLDKHPTCAACGHKEQLEVHHIIPYHIAPNLELDPTNLITLCDAPTRPCHRCFGHLWDWHKSNPYVRTICDHFLSTANESTANEKKT